jgi:hypothetical protein
MLREPKLMPRFKTENELIFDDCVRSICGVCLDDILLPDPKSKNADYFFESDNVIIELKRLVKDPLADPDMQKRIQEFYNSWINKGLIRPSSHSGNVRINIRDLPHNCAIELLGVMKKKFDESYIKEANRQIKSTKELLGKPDARGLLLLMNEGNFSYHPSAIFNLLFHIFNGGSRSAINQVVIFTIFNGGSRSAINQVVIFTSDFVSTFDNSNRGFFYWLNPSIGDREDVSTELLHRLSNAWRVALTKKHPEINDWQIISKPDPELIDKIKHVRPLN